MKRTIQDVDFKNRRVLMRVDFNVPQDKTTGEITNTQRIAAALPTIRYVLDHGGSLVLMSHLGRPNGKRNLQFTLKPVAKKLEELLERPVQFVEDCVGVEVEHACNGLKPGEVLLLENLRFHIEEEGKAKNEDGTSIKADPVAVADFRAALTRLGQIYVNDAFGTAHRAHSSVVGIDLHDRVAGFLMDQELRAFASVLDNPKRPFLAILGGAKVADKIPLINNLIDLADEIIIGGGMACTFNKELNRVEIGNSLYDADGAKIVHELMNKATEKNVKIHLPIDYICADKFAPDANTQPADATANIPNGWSALDCGPRSIELFKQAISRANTVVWNGPPGVFEFDKFSHATQAMANTIAEATKRGAITVIGGGDTATAAKKFSVADKVTHCSTGGGASLELLEGKPLPGISVLQDKL